MSFNISLRSNSGFNISLSEVATSDFEFIGSAEANFSSTTGEACDKPTGVVEDDIMFAFLSTYGNIPNSVPSGWIRLGYFKLNSSYLHHLYYKVAGASEPSDYTWGLPTTGKLRILIIAYRGGFYIPNPIQSCSGLPYITNDTSNIAKDIDVPMTGSPLIFFGAIASSSEKTQTPPTSPITFTEDYDGGSISPDFWQEVASGVWGSSGNTGDVTSILSAASAYKMAFLVSLNPSEPDVKALSNTESWNYDAGSTQTSLSCDKPTDVEENDLMFALVTTTGDYPDTLPSGWTLLATGESITSSSYALYYKVAGASEPTSYTWGWAAGTQKLRILITAVRGGFDTADPIDTYSASQYTDNDSTNKAASITVSAINSILLYFGSAYISGYKTHTSPSNGTFSFRRIYNNYEEYTDFPTVVAVKKWDSSGATGDITATLEDGAATNKMAFAVALNPYTGITLKGLKIYLGGSWIEKPLKKYIGGSWVTKGIYA